MKKWTLAVPALAILMGMPLAAQDSKFGLSVNLAVPTGGFNSTTYSPDPVTGFSPTDSYNLGAGLQATLSVPVSQRVAVRFGAGFESFDGTSKAGYYSMNLQQQMFSLGADAQFFFPDGNARRQSGTYLLAGASVDFEHFDASYGNPEYDPSVTLNKTRLGGVLGLGHSFRARGGMRFMVEGAYHKTLTQTDLSAGDPPGTDFLRFSFGVIL